MVKLNVNDADHELDIDPQMPLLWVLRDHLDMTGTKFGCGQALCGACTAHLDGEPVRSCQTFVGDIGDSKVTTIEGVSGKVAEAVCAAWTKLDVVQCGYCQSGQIMSAIGLLSQMSRPTEDDITAAMEGNICRCGTYQRIRAAIHDAAAQLG